MFVERPTEWIVEDAWKLAAAPLGLGALFGALGASFLATLFLGLGGTVALQGHGNPPTKKLVAIFHGVGLFLILLGGFGMLAKLPYGAFPGFAIAKLAVWIALGGMLVLGKRRVFSPGLTWILAIVLGIIAAWLGIMKPGAKPVPVQSEVSPTVSSVA